MSRNSRTEIYLNLEMVKIVYYARNWKWDFY